MGFREEDRLDRLWKERMESIKPILVSARVSDWRDALNFLEAVDAISRPLPLPLASLQEALRMFLGRELMLHEADTDRAEFAERVKHTLRFEFGEKGKPEEDAPDEGAAPAERLRVEYEPEPEEEEDDWQRLREELLSNPEVKRFYDELRGEEKPLG
jgi:hypothetical protein